MTEAEVIELAATCAANSFAAFTIYISFTFGFLATAFFVGSKLTRFQALAATGMYLVTAGTMASAAVIWLQGVFLVLNSQNTVLDALPLMNGSVWVVVISMITTVGMLVSLYFMWDVMHRKTE